MHLVVLGLLLSTVGGVLFFLLMMAPAQPTEGSSVAVASRDAAPVEGDSSPVVEEVDRPRVVESTRDAGALAPTKERIDEPRQRRPSRRKGLHPSKAAPPSEPLSSAEPPTPPEKVASAGRGYLRVGGVGAQNAEIVVDGRVLNYAPALVPLSVGSHRVVLRREGQTLAQRDVTIGAHHTSRNAFRWILR